MAWVSPITTIEGEFSGVGNGWTDFSVDLTNTPIVQGWGIQSHRPGDRTAGAGPVIFEVRNDADNSGSQLGYYSPNNANVRSGWQVGMAVRVKQTYGGSTYYKHARIDEIIVAPGSLEGRTVRVVAFDYMDDAARANTKTALQTLKRSDEVFSAVLASMTIQPLATSIQTGKDTYAQALDNVPARERVLTTWSDLSRSEGGIIGVKRDATVGETLFFENRHTRAATSALLITLDEDMHNLNLVSKRSDVLNRFRVTAYPRKTSGLTGIVVAILDNEFSTALAPGEEYTFTLDYTDPTQRDTKIGAYNQITPAATTDYTMNTVSGGGGTDLSSDFSVTPTYYGSYVELVVKNNHATLSGYVLTLQVRGDGILALNPVTAEAADTASQALYGDNLEEVNLRFQEDPYTAAGMAAWFTSVYSNPLAHVRSVTFVANQSDALMTAAMDGDMSSKITLTEAVSGLSANEYYINGVQLVTEEFERTICTWWLTPADTASYWLLGTVGASELGTTTRLGFF